MAHLLLLPFVAIEIENICKSEKQITLQLTSTAPAANCPKCGILSARIHKYYQRKVNDLAWADYQVKLQLRLRFFYCRNVECAKRTFAERFDPALAHYARRTARLETFLGPTSKEDL